MRILFLCCHFFSTCYWASFAYLSCLHLKKISNDKDFSCGDALTDPFWLNIRLIIDPWSVDTDQNNFCRHSDALTNSLHQLIFLNIPRCYMDKEMISSSEIRVRDDWKISQPACRKLAHWHCSCCLAVFYHKHYCREGKAWIYWYRLLLADTAVETLKYHNG